MEILLDWPDSLADDGRVTRNVAVTMRTPGNDAELAMGFLYTEGVVRAADEIARVLPEPGINRVTVSLHAPPTGDVSALERNFYMTSSCGVCGKASIDAVRMHAGSPLVDDGLLMSSEVLVALPRQLAERQTVYQGTGSIHAAGMFDAAGLCGDVYEDVGRHNAVDKLLGAAIRTSRRPLSAKGLLVSGRASFELVQKARMAGCAMLASVGAPSTLAIDLAWDANMTLVGFLRDGRFNVYAGPTRISVL